MPLSFLMNIEISKACNVCQSARVIYTENKILYKQNVGDWPMCYYCLSCRASVSCHDGTNIPKGLLANREVKAYRTMAHEAFDRIWMRKIMTRFDAYQWLADILCVPVEMASISQLSKENLIRAIEISNNFIAVGAQIMVRRRKKKQLKEKRKIKELYESIKRHRH